MTANRHWVSINCVEQQITSEKTTRTHRKTLRKSETNYGKVWCRYTSYTLTPINVGPGSIAALSLLTIQRFVDSDNDDDYVRRKWKHNVRGKWRWPNTTHSTSSNFVWAQSIRLLLVFRHQKKEYVVEKKNRVCLLRTVVACRPTFFIANESPCSHTL